MLKYIYFGFFALVVLGMWMIFHYGIQPKAVSVIKPSYLASHVEGGELLHKVLYPRIGLHNLIVWGTRLEDSTSFPMLEAFIKKSQTSERPFYAVVFFGVHWESRVPVEGVEFVEAQHGGSELSKILKGYIDQNKRVLLVLNALEAIHFGKENEIQYQENMLKTKAISIVLLPLTEQVDLMESLLVESCSDTAEGVRPHSLGCLQSQQNINAIKKNTFEKNKHAENRWMLILDQEGERDYIGYYHSRPNQ